jgi:nicotinamide-nucleotide amidase
VCCALWPWARAASTRPLPTWRPRPTPRWACRPTIRDRLGAAIYATGDATLEAVIADLLADRGATLVVAETVTQGDLSRRLSAHPNVFRGGVVAADGEGLAQLLGLDWAATRGEEGAVALAEGVRRAWQASYGLSVLGVVGEEERPWIAVANQDGASSRSVRFRGRDRRARDGRST